MENPFEIILKRLDNIEQLIGEIKEEKNVVNKILDLNEVSELLKVSPTTVYGYTHRNYIPFMKKGRKLYFDKSEIEAWLLEGRNQTKRELKIKSNKYLFDLK